MKKFVLNLIAVAGFVAVSVPVSAETFSWSELRRADGNVEDFSGQAWSCQAKTTGGSTECTFGKVPAQPGCYVMLNQDRTAWVSVDDAAGKLGSEAFPNTPDFRTNGLKGYGCGLEPKKTDYWLIWKMPEYRVLR